MGKFFSKLFGGSQQEQWRVLLLGLDAAGKTTTLYTLKSNELREKTKGKKKKKNGDSKEDEDDDDDAVPTVPTIGFNVETVEYKDLKFNVWDVGGQDRLRPLWRQYYSGTHGIMFIIDSNDTDRDRIQRAKEELHGLMNELELRNAKLAVVLNKRDLAEGTKITQPDGTQVNNTIEFWTTELQLEAIQRKRVSDLASRKSSSKNLTDKNRKKKNKNATNETPPEKRYYATFPAIAKSLSNRGIFDALDWLHINMEPL